MVREKAYAKLNIFLNVVNKRKDGYHNLEMIMAPLLLHDALSFKPTEKNEIRIITDKKITKNVKQNIIYKVAKELKKLYKVKTGVDIYVKKSIPMGAGLAGGSADAAATLRGLNKLWNLNLSLEKLAKIGKRFGADIPFCIYNKLSVVKGVGDELIFLEKELKFQVLIVYPNIELSTKRVFGALEKNELNLGKLYPAIEALHSNNISLLGKAMYNTLEKPAFRLEATVKKLKQTLVELENEAVLMSGSGSAVFVINNSKSKIKEVEKAVNGAYITILTKIKP